jgi:AMP nucleosidase
VIGDGVAFAEVAASDLRRHFPTTQLAHIGDEIADGEWWDVPGAAQPLALFDALRVDFSLARLRTTAAPSRSISSATCCSPTTTAMSTPSCAGRWSRSAIRTAATPALAGAGGLMVTAGDADPDRVIADGMWRRHQMPAYHLIAEGGCGITLVNIGVGPSNAKTITDHLAVLRPRRG